MTADKQLWRSKEEVLVHHRVFKLLRRNYGEVNRLATSHGNKEGCVGPGPGQAQGQSFQGASGTAAKGNLRVTTVQSVMSAAASKASGGGFTGSTDGTGHILHPPPVGGIEETLDHWSRNPLMCWLCDEYYEDPRLLSCYHSFCSGCLTSRIHEGKIFCVLCGKVTVLKDGQLPSKDNLMSFLVESSCEERPPCANCDKINQGMFFCNTCGQALCGHCREETHRARMFSMHDIIHMSKRGRDVNKKCTIHGEPYIMFSTTKRAMLCINCFRESSVEARLHSVDLDTAYGQGCKKLDRALMIQGETLLDIDSAYSQFKQKLDRAAASIRELQNSVRDGVILFKALLDELRKNTDTERHSINFLAENLQETIRRMQDHLLREVDGQYESKDKLFRSQLSSLGSLLPIIQVHLLMCTTFSSSASKYEFLDLVFQLMERLAAIAHISHPLRPAQSSQITTNYKGEFARALEPLLSVSSKRRGESLGLSGSSGGSEKPSVHAQASTDSVQSRPPSGGSVMGLGFHASRRSLSAAKLKIIETGGQFAEHCKSHEGKFRDLSGKFTRLKEEAQELHRDVTLRRCLTKRGRVEEIVRECSTLEDDFRAYGDELEECRLIFDSTWDEQIQRIYAEQEVFQSQVNDLATLRDENKRLMIIAQQLEPYIRSITALMGRISPKLQPPSTQGVASAQQAAMEAENANVNSVMQQILEQIVSCKPEQTRIESRGTADGSNRTPNLLDDSGALLVGGIPKPPDPPHLRGRTNTQESENDANQAQGFSQGPVFDRAGEQGLFRRNLNATSPMASSLSRSCVAVDGHVTKTKRSGSCNRRKRQNSDGDTLIWRDDIGEWTSVPRRRGSEGSEIDARKGVLTQLFDKVLSREEKRAAKFFRDCETDVEEQRSRSLGSRIRRSREKQELAELLIDRAAATFDPSAIPERPKSACETTLLHAARKLYDAAAAARPSYEIRKSTERMSHNKNASRSRNGSSGRTRSAEREAGIRTPKSVPPPCIPQPSRNSYHQTQEVRAIVHAEAPRTRGRLDHGQILTMPRKGMKKENIYENVPVATEKRGWSEAQRRSGFKKQNSLDTLSSNSRGRIRKNETVIAEAVAAAVTNNPRRNAPLKKADSFEGHEEAVRTLVAAVQENRNLRMKKPK